MIGEFLLGVFSKNVFEKDLSGNSIYMVDSENPFSSKLTNLEYAISHPILSGAMLFIANLFAQARFSIVDKTTKDEVKGHKLLKLLNKPNYLQTRIDFLEEMQFLKTSQGVGVIYLKRGIGSKNVDSMYILRSDLITYPEGFSTPMTFDRYSDRYKNQVIIYKKNTPDELRIRLKDIVFLWDMPPIIDKSNRTKNNSKIDGLQQTLANTIDSLIAKNIILKTNGKEMLSSGSSSLFPFGEEEQDEAKKAWNSNYGLASNRSRVYMTKANATWQSLHIALRDLGLDESVKVDGNIIYTTLNIPPDVLSLDRKKSTYANFKESMTSYIQNNIQSMANDLTESINYLLNDDNLEIIASYDHLPVMQFLNKQKYESINAQAVALISLRSAGLPDDMALDLVNLPKNTKLGDMVVSQQENNSDNSGGSNNSNPEENR